MKKTGLIKEKKIIMLGVMDSQGYELDNRVYSAGGALPTQRAGNARITVVRKYEADKKDRQHIPHK